MYDYIIAGAGLAGSLLSFFLHEYGKTVLLVDVPHPAAASLVATGIINPVTGQRLTKARQADIVIPFARQFYRSLEAQTGKSFFREQPVLRIFRSQEECLLWQQRRLHAEYALLLSDILLPDHLPYGVHAPFGAGMIYGSGCVDLPLFLPTLHALLPDKPLCSAISLQPEDIVSRDGGLIWQNFAARQILFCEGWRGMNNTLFSHIPFMPSHGETLLIEVPALTEEFILNAGIHIAPLGRSLFKAGATNNWDKWEETTTPEGRKELTDMLERVMTLPYLIHEHKAGIRPVLGDRFPVVGMHPSRVQVGIFNGLGSKGASLGPWVAAQFAAYLEEKKPLSPEIDISRFNGSNLRGNIGRGCTGL